MLLLRYTIRLTQLCCLLKQPDHIQLRLSRLWNASQAAERDPIFWERGGSSDTTPEATTADAITAAARQVAETVSAAVIVTYTTSGSTSIRAARERPTVPILCVTEHVRTARRLAVVWGYNA